jgi:hypothetical protein
MLVVGAASLALVGNSIKFANSTYNLTDAEQSLRNAHGGHQPDLTNAGDGLRGIGTITAPVAFVQSYMTRTPVTCNDANFPCIGIVTSMMQFPASTANSPIESGRNFQTGSDRISMLIRDTTFNSGNTVSLFAGKISVSGASTIMVVAATEIGLFQVGEIYALTSQNNAAFGVVSAIDATNKKVTLTSGDAYGLNQNSAPSSISQVATFVAGLNSSPVAVMRLQIIQYYVTSTGLLMRRVIGVQGKGFNDTVVAEHVSSLAFRYVTNLTDSNGNVIQPMGHLALRASKTQYVKSKLPSVSKLSEPSTPSPTRTPAPTRAAPTRMGNRISVRRRIPRSAICSFARRSVRDEEITYANRSIDDAANRSSHAHHHFKFCESRPHERGGALLTSLIIMSLLAAVSMTVLAVVTHESRIAGSDLRRTRLSTLRRLQRKDDERFLGDIH